MNIDELSIGFSKLVRNINTRNPKWKEFVIGDIYWQISHYLNNEIFHHKIIQYDLDIKRIGQSIIECNIKYIEYYYDRPKYISFQERIKSPSEVCQSVLFAAENIIIEQKNKENHSAKISGIL